MVDNREQERRERNEALGIDPYETIKKQELEILRLHNQLVAESIPYIRPIGPDKQGLEIVIRESVYDSEVHRLEEPYPGMVVTFDADGSVLGIDIESTTLDMLTPADDAAEEAAVEDRVWHVVLCVPGLNINEYFGSPEKPTYDQIQAWWASKGSGTVLRPIGYKGPLRDAYPALFSIDEIKLKRLPKIEENPSV